MRRFDSADGYYRHQKCGETRVGRRASMSRSGADENALPDAVLLRLWEAAQPEIDNRLRLIERCIVAWRAGTMDQDSWRSAGRAAHQLAGSLGVLEHRGATELARQLNQVFSME